MINQNNKVRSPKADWHHPVARLWSEYQWTVIGVLAVVAFFLGFLGFSEYFDTIGQPVSKLDLAYFAIQLFTLESGNVSGPLPWTLQVARWLSPGVLVYTAAKAFLEIFRDQFQLFRVRFVDDHVVVCGLGEKGYSLITAFRQQGYRVVGIERDENNDKIALCRERRAIVLVGDAMDKELLSKAGVQKAKYVFSVCGDEGANIEVAVHAKELVRDRSAGVLSCFIHIANHDLAELLREKELSTQSVAAFRPEFFNLYEHGARKLLSAYPLFPDIQHSKALVHLIIVGLNSLGVSLLTNAARLCYTVYCKRGKQLKLTLVDQDVGEKWGALIQRYPQLEGVGELELLSTDLRSAEFRAALGPLDHQGSSDTRAYICRDDDRQSLSDALELRRQLRARQVPIVVCMHHDIGLAALLQSNNDTGQETDALKPFNLIDQTCTPDLLLGGTHEILARAIHDDYVQEQRAAGQTHATNPSLRPWDELPETLKNSNRRQADNINTELNAVRCAIGLWNDWSGELLEFSDDEIERMAIMEHQRWVDERQADGWSYAAGEKNTEARTSPYLVPWDKITDDIQELDRNTVRHLPLFLAKAGFEVYRLER